MITALVGGGTIPTIPSRPVQAVTPPRRQLEPAAINSPVLPTPTKLPRFLAHAEKSLGVAQARTFESPMRRNGYGPDIMHLLENTALEDIGMSKGDVLRMKAGAQQWWNGPDAKKKRVDSEHAGSAVDRTFLGNSGAASSSGGSSGDYPKTPENKKVSFELRYPDGGAQRFYGPRLSPGTPGPNDKNTWYRCPVRNTWEPIPPGYRAIMAPEDVPEDDDFSGGGSNFNDNSAGQPENRDEEAAAALNALRGNGW